MRQWEERVYRQWGEIKAGTRGVRGGKRAEEHFQSAWFEKLGHSAALLVCRVLASITLQIVPVLVKLLGFSF